MNCIQQCYNDFAKMQKEENDHNEEVETWNTIPAAVKKIGPYAFGGFKGRTSLRILGDHVNKS